MNFVFGEAQKWIHAPWVVKPLVGVNEIFGKDTCARRGAAATHFKDVEAHIPELVVTVLTGYEYYRNQNAPLTPPCPPSHPPSAAPHVRPL